jgi:hypothetical protein
LVLPKRRSAGKAWHRLVDLLVNSDDVDAITKQLKLALLLDCKLDVRNVGD